MNENITAGLNDEEKSFVETVLARLDAGHLVVLLDLETRVTVLGAPVRPDVDVSTLDDEDVAIPLVQRAIENGDVNAIDALTAPYLVLRDADTFRQVLSDGLLG